MRVQLWWGSGSPFAWRVQLGLAVKGVPYDSHLVSFSARDHKTPEYLARNPRGKVPVLQIDDLVVYESNACLRALDRAVPTPPLFGGTPAEMAAVDRLTSEADGQGWGIGSRVVRPLYFGWHTKDPQGLSDAMEEMRGELHLLTAELGDRDTLVGRSITAADLAWYPLIRSLVRAAHKPEAAPYELGVLPLESTWPAIAAWMRRVEAIDGFEATWPPHWGAVERT